MAPIILYDIPSKVDKKVWSPNVQKTRFTLNYKRIPFVAEWWEFNEIEPKCKELGIPPTGKKPDGTPFYSFPAIYDPSTGAYVSDSIRIAAYLDKQYPDTPRLIPDGTAGLQHAFNNAFATQFSAFGPLITDAFVKIMNPPSEKYIRAGAEADGKTVEEKALQGEARKAQWAKAKESLHVVDEWIRESGGVFLGGDQPVFSDFEAAGWIFFLRHIFGKESELWQDFLTWDEGRWGRYVSTIEQWLSYN